MQPLLRGSRCEGVVCLKRSRLRRLLDVLHIPVFCPLDSPVLSLSSPTPSFIPHSSKKHAASYRLGFPLRFRDACCRRGARRVGPADHLPDGGIHLAGRVHAERDMVRVFLLSLYDWLSRRLTAIFRTGTPRESRRRSPTPSDAPCSRRPEFLITVSSSYLPSALEVVN